MVTTTLFVGAPLRGNPLVGLAVNEFYFQNSTAAPTTPYGFNATMFYFQTPGQYTAASVTYPGAGSPQALPTVGTEPIYSSPVVSTLADFQTAYPFGTYTFNLSNGTTIASASVNYTANYFGLSVPAFTGATYTALQGVNSVNGQTLNFDAFIPNPAVPSSDSVDVTIINNATNLAVFDSGFLPGTTTSVVIPAGTLQPNTSYRVGLRFDENTGFGNNENTTAVFTTANALNLQGGTSSLPVVLVSSQPIGQVAGTIAGLGAEDYYSFLWAGGDFSATASITGASTDASYLFTEGISGTCNTVGSATLDGADSFSGTIAIANLPAGQYCIGIDANNANDPAFALTFNTPVGGVPEPSTFLLLSGGLVGIVASRRTALRRAL